ncbi:13860_t:CDS:2 [Ambispora leptoticha]|uniref:13860_t:CDS:1 n=1 Tax=Ambispora leptoticha TaxID=144679 RepID=A0A9N8V428_9GLOM|nr:13860_t:CDS:2 [Ambispora leptoticha]
MDSVAWLQADVTESGVKFYETYCVVNADYSDNQKGADNLIRIKIRRRTLLLWVLYTLKEDKTRFNTFILFDSLETPKIVYNGENAATVRAYLQGDQFKFD